MRYYKQVENDYILAIGTGGGGTEIEKSEFDRIITVIRERPVGTATTDFRLKTDLTWEEYERPYDPRTEQIDDAEALNIIMGRGLHNDIAGSDDIQGED